MISSNIKALGTLPEEKLKNRIITILNKVRKSIDRKYNVKYRYIPKHLKQKAEN